MITLKITQGYYEDEAATFPGVDAKFKLGDDDSTWDSVLEAFLYALKYSGYIYDVEKIMFYVEEYKKEAGIGPFYKI